MTHHLVGMAEIAEMLGVTRQRVSQLIETYEDFPKPEVELSGGRVWSRTAIETWIASHPDRGPGRPEEGADRTARQSGGLFSRFTDRARQSVVKAQEEARLLKHNYIGTEHLLLGLIAIGEGLAWEALGAMDVSLEPAREGVRTMIGEGSELPQGHIPFTPRAKKVLELSLRESRQFGHNYIGTEHILLALIREKDGVAWQVLEKLGLKQTYARSAVIGAMGGLKLGRVAITVPTAEEEPEDSAAACSFCGKRREDTKKLVAGPGVSICDECVALAADVVASQAEDLAMPFTDRLARIEERLKKLEEPPDV
jgi:ATP-dependent Clp protease ATP-binding subunit ClpA/predicted DNA-binding transcriptional regulator AlpA